MTGAVVVFCMGGIGHVQILLSVVSALASRGCTVHMMTRWEFRRQVETAGARFLDLYAGRALEAADATSVPFPSRFVTFAATYAEGLCNEVAALAPALVVYDTFSVAAPVVARRLGVPYVNVFPNHAPVPSRMIAALRHDPRVAISAECHTAVERLREVHGMSDANPFSYYDALSPYLNLYPEPAEFLAPDERAALEPIAFFGSLSQPAPRNDARARPFPHPGLGRRIFVSFGTGVWRYFSDAALAALNAVSAALAERDVDVLVSLGRARLAPADRRALRRPNVRVVDYADQWAALAEADAFITHHGINSTHESIFHGVPMVSYPFFGDQPALARRCHELSLAVPLTAEPRGALASEAVLSALSLLTDERRRFAASLAEARSWELRTIADRGTVLDRLFSLA